MSEGDWVKYRLAMRDRDRAPAGASEALNILPGGHLAGLLGSPRSVTQWVICKDTGDQAVNGACVHHGGDACLIVVERREKR